MWKDKPLHEQLLRETLNSVDMNFQWKWLSASNLKKETEGFIFACQDQAVPTNLITVRIFQQPGSVNCRLCGSQQETVDHLLTSCSVNIYVTIVSTTLELRTSTTKLPSVHTSRWTGSAITRIYDLHYLAHFLHSFYVHYCIHVQMALLQICDRACKNRACGHKLHPITLHVISQY